MMPQSITKSAAKESAFILLSSFSGKLGIRNFSLRALNINMSKKNKSDDASFDLFDTPPKDVQNGTPGIELTESQQRAYQMLEFIGDTQFAGMQRVAGVETRPIPLIVGPSGAGKTALVREYARRTDLPIFATSATNWIVRCGRKNTFLVPPAP